MDPKWLEWVQRLQAIAQSGLAYSKDTFDIERYGLIRDIAAEIGATYSGMNVTHLQDLFARQTGYATPKVDVRGAIFKGHRILLVREFDDGLWALPGGWADVSESPSEAVVREVREESGFSVRAIRLVALYDEQKHTMVPHPFHIYKLIFECELVGEGLLPRGETTDIRFFAGGDLPPLSPRRGTAAQIARVFEHHRDAHLPADFD